MTTPPLARAMFRRNTLVDTFRTPWRRPSLLRPYGSQPPLPPQQPISRIAQIESKLPRSLQRYTHPLRHAPVSHVAAFLLLHELTAIVPLFGLAAVFHYANWLPPYISEGKWFREGTERIGGYMRKRGWLVKETRRERWWGRGEVGVRILAEFATAYAITKVLLPLRLVVSVWATPWFASRTIVPLTRRLGRLFSGGKAKSSDRTAAASPKTAVSPATHSSSAVAQKPSPPR